MIRWQIADNSRILLSVCVIMWCKKKKNELYTWIFRMMFNSKIVNEFISDYKYLQVQKWLSS